MLRCSDNLQLRRFHVAYHYQILHHPIAHIMRTTGEHKQFIYKLFCLTNHKGKPPIITTKDIERFKKAVELGGVGNTAIVAAKFHVTPQTVRNTIKVRWKNSKLKDTNSNF